MLLGQTIKEASEKGQKVNPVNVHESQTTFPVFNLIARAAKETNLTRPTILRMFKGMSESSKSTIFKNQEGFANVFISTIKELLASHIAERIEYIIKDGAGEHLEAKKSFLNQLNFLRKNSLKDQKHHFTITSRLF